MSLAVDQVALLDLSASFFFCVFRRRKRGLFGRLGVKPVDDIFIALGVLFVIVLVAQAFQKPERRRRSRRVTPAGKAARTQWRPVRRPEIRRYPWQQEPVTNENGLLADYLTIGFVVLAALMYLMETLLQKETF